MQFLKSTQHQLTLPDDQKIQLDRNFKYADGFRLSNPLLQPTRGLSEAERHRLVRATKSPTSKSSEIENAYHRYQQSFDQIKRPHCLSKPAAQSFHEPQPIEAPKNHVGCKAVIEYRDWSDEYRIRTEIETTSGMRPPEQSGIRESFMLSDRGARKIADSCNYLGLQKGGFKTFVTGTFSQSARDRIKKGDTTIQREVSRMMDALSKMYQRGWVKSTGEKIPGHDQPLPYLWVVEVPKNENGEDNPHVHFLMAWSVNYCDFKEWSTRLEKIWNNGYFHLEKIKDCMCAGAYMAKAAGYMTKSNGDSSQGLVRGNRYGISTTARAPGWARLRDGQLHTLGQLIVDIHDFITVKYGEKYREKKSLKAALDKIPKEYSTTRQKIGKRLERVRREVDAIPIVASRHQLILKGKKAYYQFLHWLTSKEPMKESAWLPSKAEGVYWDPSHKRGPKDTHFFRKLWLQLENSKLLRRLKNPPAWLNWSDEEWGKSKWSYEEISISLVDSLEKEDWRAYEQLMQCNC